jgi:Tol biopolymer transport system component
MRRLTNTGSASECAVSPDGRYVVHVVGTIGKPSLWLRQVSTSSNVQIVAPMEGAYGGITFTPDGESILYLFYPPNTFGSIFQVPLLGGPPRRLIDDADAVPTYSPDGRRMAFVHDLGQGVYSIILADADGSNQRQLAARPSSDPYTTVRMAWSPDSHEIATFAGYMPLHYSHVVLVDVETGKDRALGNDRFDAPGSLAWMPDGRTLVFDAVERGGGFDASGQLWSISYPEGILRRITSDVSNYSNLGATRDGRALVAVQHDDTASLWIADADDVPRARPLGSPSPGRDGRGGLDWTPDGHIVYSARTQGSWDLWMTDPRANDVTQVTSDPGLELWPRVLPDGHRIALVARPAGEDVAHLRVMDVDGTHARDLLADPVQPSYLQVIGDQVFFRRRGGRLSVNPVQRMALSGGPAVPMLADPAVLPPHFALRSISHDGRYGLGTTADPKVSGATMIVLPMEGGRPIRTFPYESAAFPPAVGGFGWAPDDQAVEALLLRDGAVNLWRYPLDGTPPRQLTTFTSDRIYQFAWARDGRMLAMSRGNESADVVLITPQP